MASLGVTLAGLELRNPILSASGTFGHGLEMRNFVSPGRMGALVSKTVTLAPRPGNPMARICETDAGFLNSIGLENRGLSHYIEHVLPEVAEADTLIITNIGGESVEQFSMQGDKRCDVRKALTGGSSEIDCRRAHHQALASVLGLSSCGWFDEGRRS